MKIIHCADIHLGSKIEGFPKELSEKRKTEVRNTFLRAVDFSNENGVSIILLSGDIFDRDKPYKKDTDFFYGVVESNPQIDFLMLRGNHDEEGEIPVLPNLKSFSTAWTSYRYDNVTISGIELKKENMQSYYSTLSLKENEVNIVMLHGQIGEEINLTKLREKNIDYLALGHIHQFSEGKLDDRGRYAFSGCLEGRGFDETGVKGFVLLEITDKLSYAFQPFSLREIERYQIDVSNLLEGHAMAKRVREQVALKRENIYRIELVGEVDADVEEFALDVKTYLAKDCAFISVKDCTKKKIDYAAYEYDLSLKGEFVRGVRASSEYSDEEKAQIIAYGLRALAKREVDV